MDYFALYHQEAWNLKHKIINAISEVLKEKGYAPGGVNGGTLIKGTNIEWLSDRILIDGWHVESRSVDQLLEVLRNAYHAIPNI